MELPIDGKDWEDWVKDGTDWHYPRIVTLDDYIDTSRSDRKFRLICMLSSWYEGDIIAAQIANCRHHGCDEVCLLDNDSPDDTVRVAKHSGIDIVRSYSTEFYRDELRVRLLNEWIREIVHSNADEELWVLTLDADEMIQVPRGLTLREFIGSLDSMINTFGTYSFDHYPTDKPENIPGQHPADLQPYGWVRKSTFCSPAKHWKHPIVRYTRGHHFACQTRGLHIPFVSGNAFLVEPSESLWLHHFPFREESATRARLTALCTPSSELGGHHRSIVDDVRLNGEGAIKRHRSLDLIYSQQWDSVELPHSQIEQKKIGVDVKHWSELMRPDEYEPLRWY